MKKKKDYRIPVAVDGQNIAFSHGEFINKQNKKKKRFFSYKGLIDLAKALNKNDFRPVIFLPNYWIIAKIMEKKGGGKLEEYVGVVMVTFYLIFWPIKAI